VLLLATTQNDVEIKLMEFEEISEIPVRRGPLLRNTMLPPLGAWAILLPLAAIAPAKVLCGSRILRQDLSDAQSHLIFRLKTPKVDSRHARYWAQCVLIRGFPESQPLLSMPFSLGTHRASGHEFLLALPVVMTNAHSQTLLCRCIDQPSGLADDPG
jgi:hypothetical protein